MTVRGSSSRVSLTTLIHFVKVSLQVVGFVIEYEEGIASYWLLTSRLYFLLGRRWTSHFFGTLLLLGALRFWLESVSREGEHRIG